jgi:integrase
VMIQTGLRVSELTALRNSDIRLSTGAHARVTVGRAGFRGDLVCWFPKLY